MVVTGGARFIGHHLVRALQDRGDDVLVIDDLSGEIRGGLSPATRVDRLDIARDELRHPITRWRPSIVYHLAAQVSVPRSMQDPERDLKVNALGTLRVVEAAKAAGVRRLVFTSSGGAIYGDTEEPATETSPAQPLSYYGVHKLLAEQYVRWSGIDHAIARPSNVYGPDQRTGGEGAVIAAFVSAAQYSSPLLVHGDGTQSRDFLHVADLVTIVVGLDGCTDGTAEVLRRIEDPRLRVVAFERQGKAATNNALIAGCDTDVVATTSAGAEYSPGALEALVRPFRSSRVGCVGGVFAPRRTRESSAAAEARYFALEYRLMRAGSELGILAKASARCRRSDAPCGNLFR